jgi:hypothetical protein
LFHFATISDKVRISGEVPKSPRFIGVRGEEDYFEKVKRLVKN